LKIAQTTTTLAEAVLPKARTETYLFLLLAFGLFLAVFEALFPSSFDFVDPFSWGSVLKDGLKDLGIVLGFSLGLSYIGQAAVATVSPRSGSGLQLQRILVPASAPTLLRDAVRIMAFGLLLTLFARISIHFGTNPVPLTGQTLAVLLTGAALGSRLGVLSTIMYLGMGSTGLHVYAGGGIGHFWDLASGGYLVGFVATAFLVGFLVERGWNQGALLLLAMLIGNIMLYIPGLIQLAVFVGWDKTLPWGLYPFIPGDLAKLYIASLMVPAAWAMVRMRKGETVNWR